MKPPESYRGVFQCVRGRDSAEQRERFLPLVFSVGDNKHKRSTPPLKHGKLSPLNRLADTAFRLVARIVRLASCHHVNTQLGSRSPADRHKEKALLCAQHLLLFLPHTCTHFLLKSRRRAEALWGQPPWNGKRGGSVTPQKPREESTGFEGKNYLWLSINCCTTTWMNVEHILRRLLLLPKSQEI